MARVLLVEDSPIQVEIVTGALERTRYEVEAVDRIEDAVSKITSGAFDAVILDLQLPDSEGLNTYLRMERAARDTPIIVLTSTDDEELALQLLRSGAQDYLIKGEVTSDWIIRSIRYSIERFEAARHAERSRSIPDGSLNLETEESDTVTILRVHEKQLLGDELVEQLSAHLFRLVDEGNRRKFVLDCADVDYIANSVLSQLLVWDRKIRQRGGSLRICNLRSGVRDQIKARKLLAQLDICLDEPTALRGF